MNNKSLFNSYTIYFSALKHTDHIKHNTLTSLAYAASCHNLSSVAASQHEDNI